MITAECHSVKWILQATLLSIPTPIEGEFVTIIKEEIHNNVKYYMFYEYNNCLFPADCFTIVSCKNINFEYIENVKNLVKESVTRDLNILYKFNNKDITEFY